VKTGISLLRNYTQSLLRALVNVLTGSVKGQEFLEWLNDYLLLGKIVLHGVSYGNCGIYHEMNFNPLNQSYYFTSFLVF
jgi:hypothetical protein